MESLQARLDSFARAKRLKSTRSTVKWPHPTHGSFLPTPSSLADAGFFWDPSDDDRDNVTCFLCAKQLSDWQEDDDPALLHWQKCGVNGACPWALLRCGADQDMDDQGRSVLRFFAHQYEPMHVVRWVFNDQTRLPREKAIERARKDTFRNWWPHDGKPGHGATSTNVRAAFLSHSYLADSA
jgi:hypothetical protein